VCYLATAVSVAQQFLHGVNTPQYFFLIMLFLTVKHEWLEVQHSSRLTESGGAGVCGHEEDEEYDNKYSKTPCSLVEVQCKSSKRQAGQHFASCLLAPNTLRT
jgi:hypothetical protein